MGCIKTDGHGGCWTHRVLAVDGCIEGLLERGAGRGCGAPDEPGGAQELPRAAWFGMCLIKTRPVVATEALRPSGGPGALTMGLQQCQANSGGGDRRLEQKCTSGPSQILSPPPTHKCTFSFPLPPPPSSRQCAAATSCTHSHVCWHLPPPLGHPRTVRAACCGCARACAVTSTHRCPWSCMTPCCTQPHSRGGSGPGMRDGMPPGWRNSTTVQQRVTRVVSADDPPAPNHPLCHAGCSAPGFSSCRRSTRGSRCRARSSASCWTVARRCHSC